MKRIRTIPVLLLADGGMVKTRAFAKPVYLGDPINAVKIFNDKQCDELILLDISATRRGTIDVDWIEDIVSEAFMPVSYGGGITALDQAAALYARGVEKVAINTAAVVNPGLITKISSRFGAQAVVASIDVKTSFWRSPTAYVRGASQSTRTSPVELAKTCERLGAGEIFLTSVEREGSFEGYDIVGLSAVSRAVGIPVVAHGGAGKPEHFVDAVRNGGASAVAAGSMFVFAAKGEGMLISYPSQSELAAQFWSQVAS